MYSECDRSQNKKIMMVRIEKGLWERRRGTKGRDEEKSTTQEENRNSSLPWLKEISSSQMKRTGTERPCHP